MTAVRASDVRYQSATYAPTAECRGVIDRSGGGEPVVAEHCSFRWEPFAYGQGGEAKKRARDHARRHPGHEVEVVQRTVSVYWADPPETRSDEPSST